MAQEAPGQVGAGAQAQAQAERTQVTQRRGVHPCTSQSNCCMSHEYVCVYVYA